MNSKALEKIMRAEGFESGHMAPAITDAGITASLEAIARAQTAFTLLQTRVKEGAQIGEASQALMSNLFVAEEHITRAIMAMLGSADALKMIDEIRFGKNEPKPGEVWNATKGALSMTMRAAVENTVTALQE